MPTPEPRIPTTADAGPMSYAIFQLSRAHRAYAAALLREMDLHLGQELVLMHLFDRDGQSQSELLECLGVDHSTISKALRRMQDAGLVIREPAAHDRRVMVVHLTDKGRAMREPIAALWQALEETTARNVSEQQAESFVETAYAITEAISNRALPEEEST
ncbi:MarR family winged helix-turn-helix transcriptional regulator [Streptomyces canus]|uniref:MarR family winged helix-turn-helix transcriptional regulator n=1 Tax=Streptomyces canus TaxID=58343 RepID=UPI00225212DB|nr:MarR family winged helix-turn-helix transcriptional regulator [Streptomyces canus]MCX4859292.1 MarR family winged helix-turn-helix transcriptional regulator [Streptomyces canus]WSW35457.1 MarR family winged helix-turn-helix transcriptional regulator [Streptomyces canus]